MKLLSKMMALTSLYIAAAITPTAIAQTIQVRVLNTKNGKPVANEKVNIDVRGVRVDRTYTTDSHGAFELQVDPAGSLFASTEWWITCSERKIPPNDNHVPVQDVMDRGVTLRNTCGHAKSETIKGTLTIFAREASFIEKFQR